MKRTLVLSLALGLVAATLIAAPTPRLDVAALTEGRWGVEDGRLGEYFEFKADGSYVRTMDGPGGTDCGGRFSIKDRELLIAAGSESINGSVTCSAERCRLENDDRSLFSMRKLACAKHSFFSQKHLVPAGSVRVVGSTPVVMMGMREAKATTSLKMRAGPSTSAKAYRIAVADREVDALPKGRRIVVVARTRNKTAVGKDSNYWYYVLVDRSDVDTNGPVDSVYGWVFGQYVALAEPAAK